jgi:LPXTG-motif cell wall-anchored protein
VVLRDGVEVLRVPVTVAAAVAAAAPAASPALAVTGSDAAVQTGAAGLLMLLGAVLVTVTRRRRGARP